VFRAPKTGHEAAGTRLRARVEAARARLPGVLARWDDMLVRYVAALAKALPKPSLDGRRLAMLRRNLVTAIAVRELDGHLHNGRGQLEFQLAFRHPYVVVCPKDSKHHCCAWRRELQRAEIRRGCGHLGRVVREVHGIRLLPP
jgi:hypothetical protein